MKSTQYSEKVLDHFRNPRNVGVLEGDDVASGRVGNPTCGDLMEVFIRVQDDRIVEAKFRTFGCGSAIATSSMTTEMVVGMTLDEAMQVTRDDVADELDGLPPIKMHCSNLAADALHEAIKNYRQRGIKAIQSEDGTEFDLDCLVGADEYLDNGLYRTVMDASDFEEKRTLVVHTGDESVDVALELTSVTDRVVLLTAADEIVTTDELKEELENSSVKILTESRLLEIRGEFEVEKVLIHNLDEDEDYELFVDAVVIV
ncbi:MAG: iron-sulfur cluster assembly scaffold protein [Candidatus Thorarchaeota archaeon]|nr:MAG: iron-sulfur cluster assembly scaffold protein [Candidatus Thorarchaeota archaeon]